MQMILLWNGHLLRRNYRRKGSHGTLTITDDKGNMLEGGAGAKSKGDNYVHTWELNINSKR